MDAVINDHLSGRPLKKIEQNVEKDLASVAKSVREQEITPSIEKPRQEEESPKKSLIVGKYVGAALENVTAKGASPAPKKASPIVDFGVLERKPEKQPVDDTARTIALMKLSRKISEKHNNLLWFSTALRQHFIDLVTIVRPLQNCLSFKGKPALQRTILLSGSKSLGKDLEL